MRRVVFIGTLAASTCCLMFGMQTLEGNREASDPIAAALLARVRSTGANIKNWRAEVVETSRLSGAGMDVREEVRMQLAAEAPLKMSSRNSGADRTVLICNGVETFYAGDGMSPSRGDAKVAPQCDFPLIKFYSLEDNPSIVSIVGNDHVQLVSGPQECTLLRVVWKRGTLSGIHTYCVSPISAVILRDAAEAEDTRTGARIVKTTTFTDFESNPAFPASTFQFPTATR